MADSKVFCATTRSLKSKFTGIGSALQVQIIPSDSAEVLVNIGQGKWADKAGATAVGLLVFAPLAIGSVKCFFRSLEFLADEMSELRQ